MSAIPVSAIILVAPFALAVRFLVWFLFNLLRESGKRARSARGILRIPSEPEILRLAGARTIPEPLAPPPATPDENQKTASFR